MDKEQLKKYKSDSHDVSFQRGLSSIYKNQDGSLPDIEHLDVKRASRWKVAMVSLFLLLGFLGGIAALIYILVDATSNNQSTSVALTLRGEDAIASGDQVMLTIEYENIDSVDLDRVEILTRYPEGFTPERSDPAADNENMTAWNIGSLKPGGKGSITIWGTVIGQVGSVKTTHATISYQPENFSSLFKESVAFASQISSSILTMEVQGPEEVLSEKQTTFLIRYKNNSEEVLENIVLRADYPESFIFQSSLPEPYSEENAARKLNNTWIIDELQPDQEGEIEITGGFLFDEDQEQGSTTFEIGFVGSDNSFSLQQQEIVKTTVVSQELNLDLIINGSPQNQPVGFGQTLAYSIGYKNLSTRDMRDVSVSVRIDSPVIDWSTLEDKNNGSRTGNTITWTAEEIASLDLLRPYDAGTIELTLQLIADVPVDQDPTDLMTVSSATASIGAVGDLIDEEIIVESNEIVNVITTDVQLTVEGRYFNDDNIAVGTGPLPPVVGQKTSFRVYWAVANSLHAVEDVAMHTTLTPGVEWDGKSLVSVGDISYDPETREVTWSIDRLSPNKSYADVNAWFDVSVTPTPDQVRKLIILTDQTELSANDTVTETIITKYGKALTSNLEDDPVARGKGLVIDITQ